MGKLPVLKPKELVTVLNNLGFKQIRQRGSHKQFKHADGRFTTVPFHQGKDISPILLRQIIEDIKISEEEFLRNR